MGWDLEGLFGQIDCLQQKKPSIIYQVVIYCLQEINATNYTMNLKSQLYSIGMHFSKV